MARNGSAGPDDCIFCDIVGHKAPAHVVYEDPQAIAFLDLFPFTRGHLLVVPKKHIPRLTDLPSAEYAGYMQALTNVCQRVERLSKDYNIAMNQGAAAGQIVFHLHFHVIPRYGEKNPFLSTPRTRIVDDDARRIVAALSAG